MASGLRQQGGLADAGVATNRHHAAFDNAAASTGQLLDALGVRAASWASMADSGITAWALARPA